VETKEPPSPTPCIATDQVLYSGVACITDLMVRRLIISTSPRACGHARDGQGDVGAAKPRAALAAAKPQSQPLIDDASMKGARGL
jgi:hypothetical protein